MIAAKKFCLVLILQSYLEIMGNLKYPVGWSGQDLQHDSQNPAPQPLPYNAVQGDKGKKRKSPISMSLPWGPCGGSRCVLVPPAARDHWASRRDPMH